MANAPFKMKGSPMQRNFGIGEKETPAPTKDTDWEDYATRAEKEGASEKTVSELQSRARIQKSAKEYVKDNPDSERVEPYAKGKVVKKKSEDESA